MNKAIIMGRLTRDPEVHLTAQNKTAVCSFSLAVDRRFQKPGEEKQTDFINCVAWKTSADFVAKYFRRGSKMIVIGNIQTRKFDDKEGRKQTVTEVVVEEIHFAEGKRSEPEDFAAAASTVSKVQGDGFFPPPADDTSLPFDL